MKKIVTFALAVTLSWGAPAAAGAAQSEQPDATAKTIVTEQDGSAEQREAGTQGAENVPARPKLRAGMNAEQMAHASTIVETGQEMDLPRRAYVVAIATALQESQLRVLANVNVPDSFDYQPRDGYGRDHDSVGIFQQRASLYAINDLEYSMDPRYSAMKFYDGLKQVEGWPSMPVAEAAQAVQGSAFPDAYADHHGQAELIVDSVLAWQERAQAES